MTSSPESELAWIERTTVLESDAPPWAALAELTAVRSASLCALLRTAPMPDGITLVHRVPAAAISLTRLRAEGPLRAGHVLAVALAVSGALVDLHDAGLAHGGITADQVLVAPDGSVLLAGVGAAWSRAPGDPRGPRPSDDIADVGDLVRDALGAGSGHSALVLVALRAGDADALLRPDAVELRAALLRSGRPDSLHELLWRRRPASSRDTSGHPEPPPPREGGVVVPAASLPARLGSVRIDPREQPSELVSDREPPDDQRGPRPRACSARSRQRRAPGGRVAVVSVGLMALALVLVSGLRAQPGALAADGPSGASAPLTAVLGSESDAARPSVGPSETGTAEAGPSDSVHPSADPASQMAPMTSMDTTTAVVPTGSSVPTTSVRGPPVVLDRGDPVPDWVDVLAEIDDGRRSALAAGSAQALAGWVDPDGSAWEADAAVAARVRSLRATLHGGVLEILELRLVPTTAGSAVLLVRDRRSAYSVMVTGGGAAVAVPARGPQWWRVTLRLTGERWRVRSVSAVTSPDTAGPLSGGATVRVPQGP